MLDLPLLSLGGSLDAPEELSAGAFDEINPSNLVPGTHIGAYEVVGKLGHGGMGDVYRVRRGSKQYALKIASQRHADLTPDQRLQIEERTRREIATLTALKHPHIVHCHGFDKWPDLDDGYIYFVTDLVEGQRLYVWQASKKPSLRNIVGVFASLARGLNEIHRREVFHRDIKSENVLIRNDGEPILIDFGIARPRSAYTLTGLHSITGTITHFSPALCRHIVSREAEKGVGYQFGPFDDLHPVGFMLYEMLAGRPPFDLNDANDEWKLFKDIARIIPVPPSRLNVAIPAAVDSVIVRLLAKSASECFQSGAELASTLELALETRDESWDRPFLVPRIEPGARKSTTNPKFNSRGERLSSPPGLSVAESESVAGSGFKALLFKEAAEPAHPTAAARPKMLQAEAIDAAPAHEAPFREPSRLGGVFVDPDAVRAGAAPAVKADATDDLAARIAALGGQSVPSRRRGMGLAVVGMLVAGIGSLFAITRNTGPASKSLLSRSERERAVQSAHDEDAATLPPSMMPRESPSRAAAPPSDSAPAPLIGPKKTLSDSAAIDAELAASYGRPTLLAVGIAPEPRKPAPSVESSRPSWIKGVTLAKSETAAPAAPKKVGVPFGAHVRARLKSNIDSRTATSGIVEARLLRPYVLAHETLLPVGTMLYGQAQVSAERFLVRFTKLVTPEHVEMTIVGDAIDANDMKPGLAPSRIDRAEGGKPDGLGAALVKGAASTFLGAAGGSTAGNVVSGAGQTALNHSDASPTTSGETLLLDAGADLELVVREAF